MVGRPIRQVTSTARKKPPAPPVTIAFLPASENFPLTDCSSEIFTRLFDAHSFASCFLKSVRSSDSGRSAARCGPRRKATPSAVLSANLPEFFWIWLIFFRRGCNRQRRLRLYSVYFVVSERSLSDRIRSVIDFPRFDLILRHGVPLRAGAAAGHRRQAADHRARQRRAVHQRLQICQHAAGKRRQLCAYSARRLRRPARAVSRHRRHPA